MNLSKLTDGDSFLAVLPDPVRLESLTVERLTPSMIIAAEGFRFWFGGPLVGAPSICGGNWSFRIVDPEGADRLLAETKLKHVRISQLNDKTLTAIISLIENDFFNNPEAKSAYYS